MNEASFSRSTSACISMRRSRRLNKRPWFAAVAFSFLIAITACGGTSSNGSSSSPGSPRVSSVSVSCTPATVAPNGTSQCTATVQGTGSYSAAVTWAASTGTISSTGLFSAPASAGTVTATATSTQDASKSGSASIAVQSRIPTSKHVVMVMEENQSYSTVVGNTTDWPALNSLITSGALPTNDYADAHPSIGNYFMLTTGQLLTTDDNATKVWTGDNIARHMLSAGVTFRVYAEGVTQGYL